MNTVQDFLRAATYKREHVEKFVNLAPNSWAQFNSELGYLLHDSIQHDGMDGSYTIGNYMPSGERKMVNYADRPCRINTYGNSFTQCHQVSDGETWQETLASHLGEPIRNFGIGGFGVYQAYLRLIKHESGDQSVPYVIFNLWGDDHLRSINTWRWLTLFDTWDFAANGDMFHANPWPYARLDEESGELVEHPNPYPTKESLFELCDEDNIIATFENDLVVKMLVAQRPKIKMDYSDLDAAGQLLGMELDFSSPETAMRSAGQLYFAYAWRVTEKILEKTKAFINANDKKLMVLLSYPEGTVHDYCSGKSRDQQDFLDWHPSSLRKYMDDNDFYYIDALPKHLDDFKIHNLTPDQYTKLYYIGHYNPHGNHFFAFSIKDELVSWLDPKPSVYSTRGKAIDFKGYLPS